MPWLFYLWRFRYATDLKIRATSVVNRRVNRTTSLVIDARAFNSISPPSVSPRFLRVFLEFLSRTFLKRSLLLSNHVHTLFTVDSSSSHTLSIVLYISDKWNASPCFVRYDTKMKKSEILNERNNRAHVCSLFFKTVPTRSSRRGRRWMACGTLTGEQRRANKHRCFFPPRRRYRRSTKSKKGTRVREFFGMGIITPGPSRCNKLSGPRPLYWKPPWNSPWTLDVFWFIYFHRTRSLPGPPGVNP